MDQVCKNSNEANTLKEWRVHGLGLGQADIVKLTNISLYRISDFERGKPVPAHHINVLSRAYRVTIEEFWRLYRREPSIPEATHG